jgi:hypothetical protein
VKHARERRDQTTKRRAGKHTSTHFAAKLLAFEQGPHVVEQTEAQCRLVAVKCSGVQEEEARRGGLARLLLLCLWAEEGVGDDDSFAAYGSEVDCGGGTSLQRVE